MNKEALIIFMKKPVPGRVKTRLAKTIGHDAAVEIYKQLLAKTKAEVAQLSSAIFVFYHPEVPEYDMWNGVATHKELQSAGDLGVKMKNAFQHVFANGFQKAVIIGTDCFELSAHHIEQAFDALSGHDVVIGPSNDGGYYLLGMNALITELFEYKQWSTPQVYDQTLIDFHRLDKTYKSLPVLVDIDEWEDLILFPELKNTIDNKINS